MSVAQLLRNNWRKRSPTLRPSGSTFLILICSGLTWGSSTTSLLLISPGPAKVSNVFRVQLTPLLLISPGLWIYTLPSCSPITPCILIPTFQGLLSGTLPPSRKDVVNRCSEFDSSAAILFLAGRCRCCQVCPNILPTQILLVSRILWCLKHYTHPGLKHLLRTPNPASDLPFNSCFPACPCL